MNLAVGARVTTNVAKVFGAPNIVFAQTDRQSGNTIFGANDICTIFLSASTAKFFFCRLLVAMIDIIPN